MVNSQISHPILAITEWVANIRHGVLQQRHNIASRGEFSQLQGGINAMVAEIATFRDDMEGKVEQATADLRTTLTTLADKNHALEHERHRAEEANQAKSQFLATMSHEIRTPINAIMGLTQILQQEEVSERQGQLLRQLQDSSQLLLGLINDILDVAKIEAGHLTLEQRPFPIQILLTQVNTLYKSMLRGRPIELITEMDPQLPATLIGDQLRLGQVVANLLGNALKFTASGHIRVRFQAAAMDNDHLHLKVTVEDTGIGIQTDRLESLFQPFTQADPTTTRRYGGTGLGLTICKRLVVLMGGELQVDSIPNQGSSFSFTLPLSYTHKTLPQPAPHPLSAPSLAGVMLLVVEDNPINQLVVVELCHSAGIHTITADNGQQALERLQQHSIDAVLMDIQMPLMDGYATTRLIRSNPKYSRLPILAMTAHAMEEARLQALDAGMNGFVTKPFNMNDLIQRLAEFLPHKIRPSAVVTPPSVATECQHLPNNIPGLDIDTTLIRLQQDRALYQRLLLQFLHTKLSLPQQLQLAASQLQTDALYQLVHSLKGVAANLGATLLQQQSQQVIDAIKQQRPANQIPLSELTHTLQDLLDGLTQWYQDDIAPLELPTHHPVSTSDSADLTAATQQLQNLLRNNDYAALIAIQRLRAQLPDRGGPLMATIEKDISDYEYETALQTLQQWSLAHRDSGSSAT